MRPFVRSLPVKACPGLSSTLNRIGPKLVFDEREPDNMRRGSGDMGALKKLVQVIGKTIGILVVVVIGYFAYLNWPKHQPSFNAEIVVDLVVDGETVNLQRIIECSTIARPSGSLKNVFTKRRSTVHASTVGAIGKRLKSGGAIMMWTPYRCAHEEVEKGFWTTNRRVIPNEPDYIPFMGWRNVSTIMRQPV